MDQMLIELNLGIPFVCFFIFVNDTAPTKLIDWSNVVFDGLPSSSEAISTSDFITIAERCNN